MQHNKKLTHLAQELRKGMTREEKQLWYRFLRQYPIQFKRQVTCGAYILDFYCPKAKLAIELDGSYHKHSAISANDKARDEYLVSNGIYVMRFPNRDIWHDFDRVCKQIDYVVKERSGTSSTNLIHQPHPPTSSTINGPPSPKGKVNKNSELRIGEAWVRSRSPNGKAHPPPFTQGRLK